MAVIQESATSSCLQETENCRIASKFLIPLQNSNIPALFERLYVQQAELQKEIIYSVQMHAFTRNTARYVYREACSIHL